MAVAVAPGVGAPGGASAAAAAASTCLNGAVAVAAVAARPGGASATTSLVCAGGSEGCKGVHPVSNLPRDFCRGVVHKS